MKPRKAQRQSNRIAIPTGRWTARVQNEFSSIAAPDSVISGREEFQRLRACTVGRTFVEIS